MKTIALRHLAEINPATPEFDAVAPDEPVTFLPLETVWSNGRADHDRTRPKSAVESGYTRFRAGDVVCPKVTPTFQAGRSMIAQSLGAGTTELHVLRARRQVDPRWICYAARSKPFLDEGVASFQGVAGLQRVPPEFVAQFRVADRDPDEQRRIADFLDDRVDRIDHLVAAKQEQIKLAREELTAIIDETFRRFSRGRVLVRRLFSEAPQYGVLPNETSSDPTWPRYIRTTDIGDDGHLRAHPVVTVDPGHLVEHRLWPGDVLVARSGNTIGKCLVIEDDTPAVLLAISYDSASRRSTHARIGTSVRRTTSPTNCGPMPCNPRSPTSTPSGTATCRCLELTNPRSW